MQYIATIFLIYVFIKSIYYGIFEINEKNNKSGGLTVIFLSILGLMLPLIILILNY